MCILFYLSFLPFLYVSITHATPITLAVMKATADQVAEKPAQPQLLYALGEMHNLNDADMSYMNKMAEILEKNESGKQKVHILCEVVPALLDVENGDLLRHLPRLIGKLQLNNTELEDIEIRIHSALGATLFEASIIQLHTINEYTREEDHLEKYDTKEEFQKRAQQIFGRRLPEVTFAHAITELEMLVEKALEISKKWPSPLIQQEFLTYIESARKYIQSLKLVLARFNIDQSSSLFKTAHALCMEDMEREAAEKKRNNDEGFELRQKRIHYHFNNAAAYLFDLFLFDRVLELRKCPEKAIILVAGERHASSVLSSLSSTKMFEYIMLPYYKGPAGQELALPPDKLDLLLKPLDYFAPKSIIMCLSLMAYSAAKEAVALCVNCVQQAETNDPAKKR